MKEFIKKLTSIKACRLSKAEALHAARMARWYILTFTGAPPAFLLAALAWFFDELAERTSSLLDMVVTWKLRVAPYPLPSAQGGRECDSADDDDDDL